MIIELKIDVHHHRNDEVEINTQLGHVASILTELTAAVRAFATDPTALADATQKLEGVRGRLEAAVGSNPQPTE